MGSNDRFTFSSGVFLCLAWCAVVVLGFGGTVQAQTQVPPYDADDAHARRLYEQYKASQERERALEAARQGGLRDANEAAYGTLPGLGVDREAVESANRAAAEAERERERQRNLIKAWDRKFSGRFGDLRETSSQAPLAPAPGDSPYRDKMDMRLKWFRYNPNAGKQPTPPPGSAPKTPGYVPRSAVAPPYPPGRSPTGTQTSAPKDKPPKLGAGIRPPDDYRDTNSGGSGGGGSSGGGGGGGY